MSVRAVRSNQQGTAVVEFAIVLPVLLLLLFSIVDIGRMLSQYNTLTVAVRDACRYAASNAAVGSTGVLSITPQLQAAAGNLVSTGTIGGLSPPLLPGLSPADVIVADAGNGYISVTASYAYQPLLGARLPTFGFGPPLSLALTLRAQTVMRVL